MEKIPEKLPEVRVIGFVVKAERAAEVQVCGELGWREGEGERERAIEREKNMNRKLEPVEVM